MSRILVDLLGIGLEFLTIMLLYETFCIPKKQKWYKYLISYLLLAAFIILVIAYSGDLLIPPVAFILVSFLLGLNYYSSITLKVLLSFTITAVLLIFEMIVGNYMVQVLGMSLEQVQTDILQYILGVLASKLPALFLVCILRIFMKGGKHASDKQYNLLMALLPVQAILSCFVVYGYSISTDETRNYALGITAVIASLLMVFIFTIILNNQRRAFTYKHDLEQAQKGLMTQIEHYQKLYQAQNDLRTIKHDVVNNLIAISGLLSVGNNQEAIDRINRIHSDVNKTTDIVNTGHPPIDAVIAAKIDKAEESGINIDYKVLIEDELRIDQLDMASIIANALDNAIEGVLRSCDVEKTILLNITCVRDSITIVVVNPASVPTNAEYKSSKPDIVNHGFGLAQMRTIAQKHNGSVQPGFNPEAGKFVLRVYLRNQSA